MYHDNYHKHKGSSKLLFKGSCALLQCFSDERKIKNDCLMTACDTDSSWLLEAGRREGQPSSLCPDYSQPDCIGTRRTQSIWVLFLIFSPLFADKNIAFQFRGNIDLIWFELDPIKSQSPGAALMAEFNFGPSQMKRISPPWNCGSLQIPDISFPWLNPVPLHTIAKSQFLNHPKVFLFSTANKFIIKLDGKSLVFGTYLKGLRGCVAEE